MIYRLHDDYVLRGWKGASCAIVGKKTHSVDFVSTDAFGVLLLCDGVTDLAEEELSAEELQTLKKVIDKGIVMTCSEENPITADQEYRQYSNRFVRSVLWSITGRCNFNCRHCYMDAPNGTLGEISHEEAMAIIDQMAECGIRQVMLTGGDPFVRPDLWDIIERLTEKEIWISQIYTNGWLLNETVLDRLEALGQKPEFSFSFDCIGWHDWLRGVQGAEKQVLNAIRLCQRKDFKTSVETCLHRDSLPALHDTIMLMGELNTRIKVGTILNTELWQKNGEGRTLNNAAYFEAMLQAIDDFYRDGMPADVTLGSVITMHKGSKDYHITAEKHDGSEGCREHHLCGAARMTGYITPDGRMIPCMPMTSWDGYTQFARIQDVGMQQALTDSLYMHFVNARIKELLEKNEQCNACEYRLRCGGGCRACALSDTNDLWGCDTMQCLFWKNGYVDRIREAADAAISKYCAEKADEAPAMQRQE